MNVLQAKNIPSGESQMIQQAKFMYSLLGKVFGKQTKSIEDQVGKQVKASQSLNPNQNIKSIEYLFPKIILKNLWTK